MYSIRNVLIAIFALTVFLLSVSCDNVTFTSSEVIIEEPSFVEDSSEGKSPITASAKIDKYMLKMEPQWSSNSYMIAGDTTKDVNADKDGFIEIRPPFNNLGFFSQGLWNFSLRAYTKDIQDSYVLVYEVNKTVDINSDSTTIAISASEILPADNESPCKVVLSDFDFLATGPVSEYGNTNSLGMKLSYKITDLSDTDSISDEYDIPSSIVKAKDAKGIMGVVENLEVGSGFTSGAYALSIYLNEYYENKWVHTGGTTISFVTVPGIEINISGDAHALDLFRYDYVDVGMGESGIIIDSGTSSSVSVNAYIVSGTSETLVESNVTKNDTVRFKPTVNNGPSTITSFKWFIDGVLQSGSSIDTDGYLTYQPSTAKTYTITYMFLDGTNYNTISGNYYLTVVSGT